MTERERQMIEAYLPHLPDPTLDDGEYYFKLETSGGPRIIKVYPLDILPYHDGIEYGLWQRRGNTLHWVDGRGTGERDRGVRFANLYDNRQDCIDQTHWWYDGWEQLRGKQMEEMRGNGDE